MTSLLSPGVDDVVLPSLVLDRPPEELAQLALATAGLTGLFVQRLDTLSGSIEGTDGTGTDGTGGEGAGTAWLRALALAAASTEQP